MDDTLTGTRPLDGQFWFPLYEALQAANFHCAVLPRWPVETKVYPIEDEV